MSFFTTISSTDKCTFDTAFFETYLRSKFPANVSTIVATVIRPIQCTYSPTNTPSF